MSPDVVTLEQPPNHRLFDHSKGVRVNTKPTPTKLKPSVSNKALIRVKYEPLSPIAGPSDAMDSASTIDISSDSDSDWGNTFPCEVDEIESESDFAPPHASELMDYLCEGKQPLIQLLCNLDTFFPTHEFLAHHPIFEKANINFTHELTRRCIDWLVEHIGIAKSSAMILLGAAMSGTQGKQASSVDPKGKGKVL